MYILAKFGINYVNITKLLIVYLIVISSFQFVDGLSNDETFAPCDIVINPNDDLQHIIDSTKYTVYCLEAGFHGSLDITRSGTSLEPLQLRFIEEVVPWHVIDQAVLDSLTFSSNSSWWIIEGITVKGTTDPLISIQRSCTSIQHYSSQNAC